MGFKPRFSLRLLFVKIVTPIEGVLPYVYGTKIWSR